MNEIGYESEVAINTRKQAITKLFGSLCKNIFLSIRNNISLYKTRRNYSIFWNYGSHINKRKWKFNNKQKHCLYNNTWTFLAMIATVGLHDHSGILLDNVGTSAKSGMSEWIIDTIPNKLGMVAFSVRAQRTTKDIMDRFMANPYFSIC